MKPPSRLDATLKIRIPQQMADGLQRVAPLRSEARGLRVGVSSVAREAIIQNIEAEERRIKGQ